MPIIDQIASALGGNLADGVADIIKLFKVDPNVALEKKVELEQLQDQLRGKMIDSITAQLSVDAAEAGSKSTFVAGWRPWVGWVCGSAMAYAFIGQPLVVTVIAVAQCIIRHQPFDKSMLPIIDMSQMWPVLLGMLGMGALRSWDKNNGNGNGH